MTAMKWAGWGEDDVAFSADDKPALPPFLEKHLGLAVDRVTEAPVPFGTLDVPEPRLDAGPRQGPGGARRGARGGAVGAAHVSLEPLDRVTHARGKSLRDLVRHRRGELGRIPDVVVRPGDEEQVTAVLREAIEADAVLIAFGGGTNISGSLEAPGDAARTIISLDLCRLDRVL